MVTRNYVALELKQRQSEKKDKGITRNSPSNPHPSIQCPFGRNPFDSMVPSDEEDDAAADDGYYYYYCYDNDVAVAVAGAVRTESPRTNGNSVQCAADPCGNWGSRNSSSRSLWSACSTQMIDTE